jgi:hypothetical protein
VKDMFLDVQAEIPMHEVESFGPAAGQHIIEMLRRSADELCDRDGARLRTDRMPEIIIKRAMHPLTGDVLLVASRWATVAPESVASSN